MKMNPVTTENNMYVGSTNEITPKVFEVVAAAASTGKYSLQELVDFYETLLTKAVVLSIDLPVEQFLNAKKE